MNTTIEFTLKTQKNQQEVETSFIFEYNEEGECIDAQAFNPTRGYTNMTQWRTGWSEQDSELETMWDALEEYSMSGDLVEYIANENKTDIGNKYTTEYYCDNTPETRGNWTFIITIDDVSISGDITHLLNQEQVKNMEEEIQQEYHAKVNHEDFLEYLELVLEDAKDIMDFNNNVWNSLKQGIKEDYAKNL